MASAFAASSRTLAAATAVAIACANGAGAPETERVGEVPGSFAECVASGGQLEPERQGGRCHAYYVQRTDLSAYLHCRNAGGVAGAVGPRMRLGDSAHVCTLVFDPPD